MIWPPIPGAPAVAGLHPIAQASHTVMFEQSAGIVAATSANAVGWGAAQGRRRRTAAIAGVHLSDYPVIGLAAGLAAVWFAASVPIHPSAGLIGCVSAQPRALRTVIAGTALALAMAVAAVAVPVAHAAPPPAPSTY